MIELPEQMTCSDVRHELEALYDWMETRGTDEPKFRFVIAIANAQLQLDAMLQFDETLSEEDQLPVELIQMLTATKNMLAFLGSTLGREAVRCDCDDNEPCCN